MTSEDMRRALHKAPFQPFNLHLADGHSIHVPHPDFVALLGEGLSAVIASPKHHGFDVVDLLLVTRIETPPSEMRSTQ